jgi:predicted DNA-binding transcriptional regulator YafY
MNRIDRLFAILLLIQRKRRLRALDLAQAFEVSERTIYRDMTALSESGVPIVALPGAGYELVEGYYLPPLLFTPAEAAALFLGVQMLLAHTEGRTGADAERALAKVALVLPSMLRQNTERLASSIEFFMPRTRFDLDNPHLAASQQAIQERRVVRLRYHSYSRDEITERAVEPHTLTYAGGAWYLNGYCRLRQDVRAFRLSRIERLELLRETFEPREAPTPAPATINVRVRFDPALARWVRERQHYAYVAEEQPAREGGPVMAYRVHTLSELVPWLLGWGASAEALDPPELREQLRTEALKLAQLLT